MNEENYIAAEQLIVKHLTGEGTEVEEKELQAWIATSEKNRQVFLTMKRTFELTGKHYDPSGQNIDGIDVEQEWSHFENSVVPKATKEVKFVPEHSKGNLWIRIAAALLLVIVSGIVINYYVSRPQDHIYRTAEGIGSITLPDGSTVVLNRHSELSYARNFGEQVRSISLNGEAFFEVVPNASVPFVVKTTQAEVTVLGTSFNVQSYTDNESVEITVESGVVKFDPQSINESLKLKAGEKGVFKKADKALILDRNENVNYLSWKTKRIVLDGNSLASIVAILKSAYGADITISTTVSPACQATVTFENQSLEAVLNVLKSTLDLTYKVEGKRIEITNAGC